MVAIAVVGGILIFVFAQGFFSSSQVEGPVIESVTMLGYDARDVAAVENHAGDSFASTLTGGTTSDNKITAGDKITFFVKNTGTQTLVLNTLKVAGETLTFDNTTPLANGTSGLDQGEYAIMDGGSVTAAIATSTLTAGQEITIMASPIDSPLKTGWTYAIEIGTGNGETFKFDFIAGIQKG